MMNNFKTLPQKLAYDLILFMEFLLYIDREGYRNKQKQDLVKYYQAANNLASQILYPQNPGEELEQGQPWFSFYENHSYGDDIRFVEIPQSRTETISSDKRIEKCQEYLEFLEQATRLDQKIVMNITNPLSSKKDLLIEERSRRLFKFLETTQFKPQFLGVLDIYKTSLQKNALFQEHLRDIQTYLQFHQEQGVNVLWEGINIVKQVLKKMVKNPSIGFIDIKEELLIQADKKLTSKVDTALKHWVEELYRQEEQLEIANRDLVENSDVFSFILLAQTLNREVYMDFLKQEWKEVK